MQLVCLESLIKNDHPYRKFCSVLNFKQLMKPLEKLNNEGSVGATGFGIETLFKCLLLQFMEDLSDRELQKFLEENTSAKWFCGFDLNAHTPEYTLFTKVRSRIGTKRLSTIFNLAREQMKSKGFMSEVFTFVDASHLISKANLWEERDKLIAKKIEKLNNSTISNVASDKQAKIGCKGKSKYWYGYKRHVSVDMQSGLINKVAVTPANITDAKGLKHICPSSGAVYGDKGYCVKPALQVIRGKKCHDCTIKKTNMKVKIKAKDRWISKLRSPYERVFSKTSHKARYHGVSKNQFMVFMQGLSFNIKRLLKLTELYPHLN